MKKEMSLSEWCCEHSLMKTKCRKCNPVLADLLSEMNSAISKLEEHKNRQIDENRAVSRRLEELKEDVTYLTKEKIILENKVDPLEDHNLEVIRRLEQLEFHVMANQISKIAQEKKTGMSFEEAFKIIVNGGKVRRKDKNYYFGKKGNWKDFDDDNIFSLNDVLANDWEIVG